ncbi:MAG: D-hexose-6-phosphate mutarotase [Phycisphaeraceae bacterium]
MTKLNQANLPEGMRLERVGELERLAIATPAVEGQVYLHGAHVAHWRPAGRQPVLWMSGQSWLEPGKPIRGGVPICFPWFGPKVNDLEAPNHGFARLRPWSLESVVRDGQGAVTVAMSLSSDRATRELWPHDFAARFTVSFSNTLEMSLAISNTSGGGSGPAIFEEALHTYFAVGDVRQVQVSGLAGATYIDKLDATARKTLGPAPIIVAGETDGLYLNTTAACVLDDPSLSRRITVSKAGSNTTVVWNPWIAKSQAMPDFGDDEWPGMICIETANAADNRVNLPPGATHVMSARITVA